MGEVSNFRREPRPDPYYLVFDARGNGEGGVSPTITGGHQSSISDYTAIILEIHEDTNRKKIL